jgi:hypothetical protein
MSPGSEPPCVDDIPRKMLPVEFTAVEGSAAAKADGKAVTFELPAKV